MSTSGQPSSSNTAQRTFCEVCQDFSECEFRKYFNRVQSSNQDWRQEAKSDRSRYYVPEQQSEMGRLRRLAQENEILDRARPQRMAMMTAEEREIQNRNFAHVEECHRTRQTLIMDHIGRFPVTGPDFFFKRTPYRLWLNSMESTSTFMGAAGCVTIGDFEYMGQVPRHESVHDLRFKAMLGEVMRLFIGELRELHALSDPDQEPEPQGPDPAKIQSTEGYTKVWELWKDFSNRSEGVWPTPNLQFKFKTCPIVLELGWLMNLLPRRRSGNGEQHALEELMVNATGTSLSGLSRRWEWEERAAALNMLKSGGLDLLIYIPTPDTEDIHNFYSQARFDSDPLNPNFRFRLAQLENPPVLTQSNSTPSGNPGPSS
ncbi:ring finger protein [Fusarium flagelliforme]|uniref:Ring finger protein n=1 Tax=Fusarium flagelliforme TaxID=2675880 RepID=A0A395MB01_9HYPO|nr:ring finger protein [Fusarium flagelliforme]